MTGKVIINLISLTYELIRWHKVIIINLLKNKVCCVFVYLLFFCVEHLELGSRSLLLTNYFSLNKLLICCLLIVSKLVTFRLD